MKYSIVTGVAASRIIQEVDSTLYSSLVQARYTVSGAIMKSIVKCGQSASINYINSYHYYEEYM